MVKKKKINSRAKGASGEREAAHALHDVLGVKARRGQQHAGGPDSPDVVLEDLDGVHVEVKRTEALSLYKAMDQAERDGGENNVPVVMHRRNHRPWVMLVKLDDLEGLIKALLAFRKAKRKEQE